MTRPAEGAHRRAAGTAALLVATGIALGVMIDRHWLAPPAVHATPLTTEAMIARLDLSAAEEARVRALLDSLHPEIVDAIENGPDSLRTTVRHAHQRIEAALPPSARADFRAWIREQHERIMSRMLGDAPGARVHERE